ncbi:hypothetical protein Q8A67_019277 [Cirrhinus molitorella]|uniref:Uncharacterized protein n=1 Tax=Cirrhinus molitorella TaxID=172907 RepID=A0AA88TG87_9TELE|nr:hypothetical protein Q8A67_019277 [Cirrhinus molitorella]
MGPKQAVSSPHARLTLSDSLPCTAVKTAQPIPHNLTVSTSVRSQGPSQVIEQPHTRRPLPSPSRPSANRGLVMKKNGGWLKAGASGRMDG